MAPSPLPSREKRVHPRVKVQHVQAAYRPAGLFSLLFSPGASAKAVIVDVSVGGMRIIAGRPQATAARLTFQLEGQRMRDRIPLTGRIVRCQPLKGQLYELGVSLSRTCPAYMGMVQRFRKDPLASQGF